MTDPALGVVEVSSIARGIVVVDAMVKKAPVRILQNHTISPGKHMIVIGGGVAEVDEAMQAGIAAAQTTLVDRLFLPQVHEQVFARLSDSHGTAHPPPGGWGKIEDSLSVFETYTVCSTVLAADAAAKCAAITVLEMRLGQHLGGKGFFTMCGPLEDIEAAAAAARAAIESGLLVNVEIIPAPHADLKTRLFF
jgi:microcompartment protein CcmL/EutN